jgi:hypothetical protein
LTRTKEQGRRRSNRVAKLIALLALVSVSIGSGTCVVVEEGPYGTLEGPGENEEVMREQEVEVMEESNR